MRGISLRPSLTTRRAVFALFWTAIGCLLTGGFLGAALAGDEPTLTFSGAVPPSLSVPAPHLGDEVNYTITEVHVEGRSFVPRGDATPFLDFTWDLDRAMLDASGLPVRAQAWTHRFHTPGQPAPEGYANIVYDARTGRSFGTLAGMSVSVGGAGSSPTITPTREEQSSETFNLIYDDAEHAGMYEWPCGLRNGFQGTTVTLAPGLALQGSCWRFRPMDMFPCEVYDPIGSDHVGEWDTVVLASRSTCPHDTATKYVWMSPSVPYPVRVLVETDSRDRYESIDLVGFIAGSTPLGAVPEPAAAAPAITLAPRQPWGPDDSDIEHPFKLSEAFRLARDAAESPIRTFLQEKRDAAVSWARFSDHVDGSDVEYSWWFYVSTPEETRGVTVRKTVQQPSPLLPVDLDQTRETRIQFTEAVGGLQGGHWEPAALVPTVGSAWAMWRAYAGPEFAGSVPNAWTIDVWCQDACAEKIGGGYASDETRRSAGPDLLDPAVNRTVDESTLMMDAEGRPYSLVESRSSWSRVPASTPPSTGNEGVKASTLRVAPAPTWTLPTEAAVGAGIAGVLVGMVYWIWPSLKGGLLGLFSRVERPSALDQPRRAAITALVEANPGIHFQEIGRRLSLGHGTVEHHLRKLVDVGILAQQTTGGYHCYFPKGAVDRRLMIAAPLLKAAGARAVLGAVIARQGSGREISAATGLDPGTVSYHVKRLAAAALVALERRGREVRVAATDLGRAALGAAA